MGSNYNFFENVFSRIKGVTQEDLISQISINNSKDVSITGNNFGQSNLYVFNGLAFQKENESGLSSSDSKIEFNPAIATDKKDRALLNISLFDRLIYECNRQGIVPTIRCYAFFSHLSSIRDRGDMSDYNQLILTEKDLFDKMLALKYHIKLIVNLDIPVILTKWYGSLSDTILRMTDLTNNINRACECHNIEVVIDEINSLDGQYILHDFLYIHALEVDPVQKYSYTRYETDRNIIQNAIAIFDERFSYLSFANFIVRKHLHAQTLGAFIKETVDSRVSNLNQVLASK